MRRELATGTPACGVCALQMRVAGTLISSRLLHSLGHGKSAVLLEAWYMDISERSGSLGIAGNYQ